MAEYFLAIMLGVYTGLFILLQQRLHRVKALLADALNDLEAAAARESVTNHHVEEIFLSLSPLLEQTDWMTGRWGGQFETLVRMERSRNSVAVGIRSKLFALPFMKDFFSENVSGILGSLPSGLELRRES